MLLELLDSSWNWGSAYISQDCKSPSGPAGTLTVSFCSWVKFLKNLSLSRVSTSQWWGGTAAMKLLSKKWQGRTIRGEQSRTRMRIWKGPKPLISSKISSNVILTLLVVSERADRDLAWFNKQYEINKITTEKVDSLTFVENFSRQLHYYKLFSAQSCVHHAVPVWWTGPSLVSDHWTLHYLWTL